MVKDIEVEHWYFTLETRAKKTRKGEASIIRFVFYPRIAGKDNLVKI